MKYLITTLFCLLLTLSYGQFCWDSQNSTTNDIIIDIDFAPTGNLVGIYGSLFNGQIGRTNDGGDTWSIVHSFTGEYLSQVYIDDAFNCIAATETKIYKSTDGGINWALKYNNPNSIFWTGAIEESNGRIFCGKGGFSINSGNHLYYSDDVGETWDSVSTIFDQVRDVSFHNNYGVLISSGDLFVSSDLGDSWTVLTGLPHSHLITELEMLSATDFITVGKNGEVYYTQDFGSTWTNVNIGTTEDLKVVEFGNGTNGIIGGNNGTLYMTNDGIAGPWTVSPHGGSSTANYLAIHAHTGTYAWAGNSEGEILTAPCQDVAIDILDLIGPDSLCQDDSYNYTIKYEVTQGIAENPAFQVLLNASNISSGYAEDIGVFGPGIYNLDLSSTLNISTEGTYGYIVTATPNLNETSTLLDYYGLNETENVFVKEKGTLSAESPLYFCPEDEVNLQASGDGLFIWYLEDTSSTPLSNSSVFPIEDLIYIVEADQGLCKLYDTVMVNLDPNCVTIQLPAAAYAFSPNGDGVNDVFVIDYLEDTENQVYIYNRWGDLIAGFANYDNDNVVWDGTYNSKVVPAGTYYFISEYNQNQKHQAWIQVVR
ncbi:MAG: gliding motility-associated C-terminal domain-containing protein [Crocinitomicaceae bacterium]|nr:gliding motility-associated C-terminal domain-containing protein [Crocinitomicaceae bacterium]